MKRYVLPTIKVLIALVVAVALTRIAFFPSDGDESAGGPTPSYDVTAQTTTAVVGDISNTVNVKGQVVEDAAVQVQATLNGVVDSFEVAKGSYITAGAPLLYLKRVEPQEPRQTVDEEGNVTTEKVPDKVTWATVYAPADGIVSYNVIEGQETTIGMVVATVAPGTYSAVGTISPSQQYQLTNAPTTAMLTLEGGPSPFECQNLTIGTKPRTASTTEATPAPQDGTSVQVRCPVPTDQQVFPGLPVTIGIDAGSATGAVLVPVTAVEGSSGTGNVWVVTDPAHPDLAEKRQVTLGINDGTSVQVTEGLSEGEEILLFVPGKDTQRTGVPNTCDQYACYDKDGKEYQ